MKLEPKFVITVAIAVTIGLIGGYFLFGNKNQVAIPDSHGEMVQAPTTEEEIWTCSMHPQIRQNEPGLCPICEMDLIPLEANTSSDPLVLQMTEAAVKLAQIETTTIGVEYGNEKRNIPLTGKVQADERLASSLVSHVPGRIEKLFVSFTGEQVKKGQKLAMLYSPELIIAQRELLEAMKLENVNAGLIDAARNKLRFWKVGEETIKNIEKEGTLQETFTLYADETGIVTNRRVSVGDYVKQGEPLFDLMNLNKVWVLFDAYEESISSISVGGQIEFTTSSVPGSRFHSQVTFIDPVINPNTRVASVRTEIDNKNGLLKPEMFVKGNYQKKIGSKSQLTVPKSAILWTGRRSVVYVKVPDMDIPSFKYREIELGESIGDSYVVLEGLEPGEEVVTNGGFTIDAAAQLNNQMSMMNKDVAIKEPEIGLPDYTAETPIAFKQQLLKVSEAYLILKDAFVATDGNQAKSAANQVLEVILNTDMSLLKDDAHVYWMDKRQALEAHTEKIMILSDVEEQRKQFGFLSESLIESIKVFGIPEDTYYVQYCPMAFDNKGADWLSDVTEIRNPFFGDKMLKCGVVKDTLTENFNSPKM